MSEASRCSLNCPLARRSREACSSGWMQSLINASASFVTIGLLRCRRLRSRYAEDHFVRHQLSGRQLRANHANAVAGLYRSLVRGLLLEFEGRAAGVLDLHDPVFRLQAEAVAVSGGDLSNGRLVDLVVVCG